MTSVAFAQEEVPSRITFVVRNDVGELVTNVTVEGCFPNLTDSGHGSFKGLTDTNGMLVVTGDAVIGVYACFSKGGYYPTTIEQNRDVKVRMRWQAGWNHDQWSIQIPILLKPIRHQIPVCLKQVENPYVDLWETVGKYRLDSTASYDMLKGVFLPPYGKGEVADMEFNWKMTIHAANKGGRALEYDTLCEIRMTNIVDGICRGTPDGTENGQRGSAYISAYEAPANGYTNAILFYRNVRGTKAEDNDDKHYLYYFRIRTQTNETGNVTNALYGKIYGQINGNFTYYLNPMPNDRNVEFDPKRNLFCQPQSLTPLPLWTRNWSRNSRQGRDPIDETRVQPQEGPRSRTLEDRKGHITVYHSCDRLPSSMFRLVRSRCFPPTTDSFLMYLVTQPARLRFGG
jgi:hypothetical protein